jgi:hypothetical protein
MASRGSVNTLLTQSSQVGLTSFAMVLAVRIVR